MWRLRRRHLVGLDIDASAVRMVQLRQDSGGYIIVRAGITEIAPWGRDPHLHRIHTVQALVEGISRCGITGKFAVCGLRGPEVVVRGFEFPALPPEEIEGAVALEVSQICPFLAEESTLDYQVTSNNDQSTGGFWVAATNGLIENTRQLVSEAGLHCALVDVTGLALLNLLEYGWRRDGGEPSETAADPPISAIRSPPPTTPAVLNLGDSCATIAIADPAGRPFVRDIGGGAFADSLQGVAAARGGIHGSVSAEDGWVTRSDHRSMTDDSLVEDIATTLRYYAAQNGFQRVDRLLIGGRSVADESVEQLRTRLNIDVELWNPIVDGGWRIEDCEVPEETRDDHAPSVIRSLPSYGPSLAVAAGLAMRSV